MDSNPVIPGAIPFRQNGAIPFRSDAGGAIPFKADGAIPFKDSPLPPDRQRKADAWIAAGRKPVSVGEASMNVDATNRQVQLDQGKSQGAVLNTYNAGMNAARDTGRSLINAVTYEPTTALINKIHTGIYGKPLIDANEMVPHSEDLSEDPHTISSTVGRAGFGTAKAIGTFGAGLVPGALESAAEAAGGQDTGGKAASAAIQDLIATGLTVGAFRGLGKALPNEFPALLQAVKAKDTGGVASSLLRLVGKETATGVAGAYPVSYMHHIAGEMTGTIPVDPNDTRSKWERAHETASSAANILNAIGMSVGGHVAEVNAAQPQNTNLSPRQEIPSAPAQTEMRGSGNRPTSGQIPSVGDISAIPQTTRTGAGVATTPESSTSAHHSSMVGSSPVGGTPAPPVEPYLDQRTSLPSSPPTESVREVSGTEKLLGREDRQGMGVKPSNSQVSSSIRDVRSDQVAEISERAGRSSDQSLAGTEPNSAHPETSAAEAPRQVSQSSTDSSSVSSLPSPEPIKPAARGQEISLQTKDAISQNRSFALTAKNLSNEGGQRVGDMDWVVSGDTVHVAHAVTGREFGTIDLKNESIHPERTQYADRLRKVFDQISAEADKSATTRVLEKLKDYPAKNSEQIAAIEKARGQGESVVGDIGVGPAGINDPAFTKKEPGAPTGIKNAAMEVERAVHGHPSATPTEPRPHEALKASVEQEIKDNPTVGADLVDELDKHPRPTDDRENFILSHRQNELNRLYEKTVNDLIAANDSGDDHARVTAEIQESFLSDKLLQLADVAKETGAKWGQSGASRQRLFNEDYSLASLVKRKRAASGGRELTQEEITTRKTLADKIKASEEKVNENEQTRSTRRRKVNTEKALTEIDAKVNDQVVKEKAAGRKRDLPAEQASIIKGLKEHAEAKDPPEKLGSYIERLYKNFRAGGLERNDALDATHAEVKKLMPEMNRDDTMDAISGFEKFKRLSGGELQAKIRQEKQEFQSLGKLRNLFQNKLFGKTGAERQSPSDIKRGLEKRVYDELKARNLKVTDPVKQAKSALDAMKTRLKNRMADLRLEMSTSQKFARDKTKVQLDEEATNLKTEYDEVKKQHDDIFGTPGLTDEQRLKIATAAAQRSEAMWKDRADNARKGIFDVSKQPGRKVTSPELEAINARRDAHHEEVDLLKSLDTTTNESAKEKSLQDSITKLKQRIATGDIDPKTGKPTVDTKRVSDLKVEQAGLEKQIRDLQNAKIPKKSPEEIALQSYKTRKAHSIADLADRIANQDFTVRQRQPIALDKEALRLKAEHERLKNIERTDLLKDRLSRRTPAEKAQDTFVKWRRGFILSGYGVLEKLTGAASTRLLINPAEEAIGKGIGKVFPGLQSRATREGRSSVSIEAKALAEGMTTGMKDAWQVLRTGKSDLDMVFGKNRGDMPRSVIDFFGNLHGAFKAPAKRAALTRSIEIGNLRAIELGLDPTEPTVEMWIGLDAYKEGQRDIFQNDSRVANAANRAINALREPDKITGRPSVGGKSLATLADTLIPIKKVPTNIVGEAMQYATGSVTGSAKLALAYRRGIETLQPHEADAIMRSLRKGSIGAAAIALGFFGANSVGGYYQPGKKRDESDVAAGGVRIFGINIPTAFLHHPLMEALQIGATAYRVAESKLRKSDQDTQGITAGTLAAALGLIEEVPFAREAVEVGKIFDPASRNSALGKTAESIAVPKVVSDITAAADSKDRKPTGFIQNIEAGVPGLRGNVPAEEPKDPRLIEKSKATEEKNTRRDALDPAIQSLLSEHGKLEQIPPLKRTQQERQRHAQLSALARTYQSYQKATTDEARNRFADQLKQNAGRISAKN